MSTEYEITSGQVNEAVHVILHQIAAGLVGPESVHRESKSLPLRSEWDDGPMAFVKVKPVIHNYRCRFEGQLPSSGQPFTLSFCARLETGHVEHPDPEFSDGRLVLTGTQGDTAAPLELSHMQSLHDAWAVADRPPHPPPTNSATG